MPEAVDERSLATHPQPPVCCWSSFGPVQLPKLTAIAVAKNSEHFGRLKHIQLRLYWLRDVIEEGMIAPEYCPTGDMLADLLTKALSLVKVAELRSLMGLK